MSKPCPTCNSVMQPVGAGRCPTCGFDSDMARAMFAPSESRLPAAPQAETVPTASPSAAAAAALCEHGFIGYCEKCSLRDPGEYGETKPTLVRSKSRLPYYDFVSDEPLHIIEANECSTANLTELATKRFRRAFNEIHALRAQLAEAQARCERLLDAEQQRLLLASEDEIRKDILADGRDPAEYLRAIDASTRLATENAMLKHDLEKARTVSASERPKSALSAKVTALRGLKANWNSYGAEAMPEATIELALKVAALLDSDEWSVVPCADGPSVWFTRNGEDEIIEVHTQVQIAEGPQR